MSNTSSTNQNKAGGFSMDWGSAIGGGLQAGASIYTGWVNKQHNKEMEKIAREQLAETKEMNKWEKDKYASTLKNQGEAMSTLGESFGKALQNESSTQNSINASSPSINAPSQQNARNSPSASNQNTSADFATSAQNSQAQENEPLLPTQRY